MSIEIAGQIYPSLYFIILGAGLGFISGLLGIGGGFILSPLLLMLHMPLAKVLTLSSAFVATNSASLYLRYYQKNEVDHKLSGLILIFALMGILTAVFITKTWGESPKLKTFIMLSYALILLLLAGQILKSFLIQKPKTLSSPIHRPYGIFFPKLDQHIPLYMLIPLAAVLGFLSTILGIGSGLIFIPFALYILYIQENWVMGTNALIMLGLTSISAIMQTWINQSMDVRLWAILSIPAVLSSFLGIYIGGKMKTSYLRLLLAACMILIAVKMLAKSLF